MLKIKSKAFKFLIGTFAVAALAFAMSASAYSFSSTIVKQGMTGPDVVTVKTVVGTTADGVYGPMTKAAVMAWQSAHGLVADGVVGPNTMAAMNSMSSSSSSSSSDETLCPNGMTLASNCSAAPASTPTDVTLCPNGMTLASNCTQPAGSTSGSTSTSTGALTGGAGSVVLSSTTADVESTATESKDNVKVLGFKVEAQDSDIAISNLQIKMKNTNYSNSSEKLSDYIDGINVVMGNDEVGSADVSDFTRDSGSPDVFTVSVPLTNAIVREGDKNTFYVEVNSGSIDSADLDATWNIKVSTIRYQDATGVVLAETFNSSSATTWTGDGAELFSYQSSSANDNITVQSSSSNPDATTVSVQSTSKTNDVLVGAFRLRTDSDSSDIKINELPISVTFGSNSSLGSGSDWADSVVSNLKVSIDGTSYDADLASADDGTSPGAGTAVYRVDLSDSDVYVNAGDTVTVKIYVDLNQESSNYDDGTTIVASMAADAMDAEGADTLGNTEKDGSYTGNTQTLKTNAVNASLTSASFDTYGTSDASATVAQKYVATYNFKVTASEDTDIYLPLNTFSFGTAGTQGVTYTVTGGATVLSASLSSNADKGSNGFLVRAGDTESFTFKVYVEGNDATNTVALTGIWYEESDATPDGTPKISTGLQDFEVSTYASQY